MTAFITQAIVTKYLGPTNSRGARIKASAWGGSKTYGYEHGLNIERNHAAAAEAFAKHMQWDGVWFQGGSPDTTGYCFVNCGHTCKDESFTISKSA
jgi:hypothetical protein